MCLRFVYLYGMIFMMFEFTLFELEGFRIKRDIILIIWNHLKMTNKFEINWNSNYQGF